MSNKIWGVLGPLRLVIPVLSFEGILPKDTPRSWIILCSFRTVLLTLLEKGYKCTYLWYNFFNAISVENNLNQSSSSDESCENLLVWNNLSNPCLRKLWLHVINHA